MDNDTIWFRILLLRTPRGQFETRFLEQKNDGDPGRPFPVLLAVPGLFFVLKKTWETGVPVQGPTEFEGDRDSRRSPDSGYPHGDRFGPLVK